MIFKLFITNLWANFEKNGKNNKNRRCLPFNVESESIVKNVLSFQKFNMKFEVRWRKEFMVKFQTRPRNSIQKKGKIVIRV